MTTQEFETQKAELTCQWCGHVGLTTEHNPNNNGLLVVCPSLKCKQTKRPLGLLTYLKTTASKKRKEYPPEQGLYAVWERYGNVCTVCSLPQHALVFLRIGLQRHHPMEYAKTGHEGPIVPICVPCHEFVTARQRDAWRWYRRLLEVYGEPPPDGGPAISEPRVPPNPLYPAGQAPTGLLEGFPDDDADQ